jgi:hypothetical protein
MAQVARKMANYVVGPDGGALTLADLPSPATKRWVARRKAEVVAAVDGGILSLEEACRRYTLSVEEFLTWQRAFDKFGQRGLRVTKTQSYRNGGTAKPALRLAETPAAIH